MECSDQARDILASIDEHIAWWQRKLCLNHWRITYKVVHKDKLIDKRALMEIRPCRERLKASIFIREGVDKFGDFELQRLLVHELTHLIIDPMAEEHAFQVEFNIPVDRVKEYHTRFTRVLERTVEHTAHIFFESNIARRFLE